MAERRHPLLELTLWRVREFAREPEAMFWIFAFPLLLAFALGIAFKHRGPQSVNIAVQQGPGADTLVAALDETEGIRVTPADSVAAAADLRAGRVIMIVVPGTPPELRYDSTRSETRLAQLLVAEALRSRDAGSELRSFRERAVDAPGSRYIDFLIPGLLGLNIMSTGMWGIGFAIVRIRSLKLLKRLLATPMPKSQFLLSHMLGRSVFLGFEVTALLLFGYFAFDVAITGSLPALAAVVLLGAATFAGFGLLVASRARTIEGVSGLMNLVMMPMWILSGVFFSWANFPDVVQPLIRLLPLTALNDALRAVIIDGVSLASQWAQLANLAFWGLLSFWVALRIFRWS